MNYASYKRRGGESGRAKYCDSTKIPVCTKENKGEAARQVKRQQKSFMVSLFFQLDVGGVFGFKDHVINIATESLIFTLQEPRIRMNAIKSMGMNHIKKSNAHCLGKLIR